MSPHSITRHPARRTSNTSSRAARVWSTAVTIALLLMQLLAGQHLPQDKLIITVRFTAGGPFDQLDLKSVGVWMNGAHWSTLLEVAGTVDRDPPPAHTQGQSRQTCIR